MPPRINRILMFQRRGLWAIAVFICFAHTTFAVYYLLGFNMWGDNGLIIVSSCIYTTYRLSFCHVCIRLLTHEAYDEVPHLRVAGISALSSFMDWWVWCYQNMAWLTISTKGQLCKRMLAPEKQSVNHDGARTYCLGCIAWYGLICHHNGLGVPHRGCDDYLLCEAVQCTEYLMCTAGATLPDPHRIIPTCREMG